VQRDPGSAKESPADASPRGFRAPTALLRQFLTISDDYEAHLAGELRVNRTDLAAMEHLIQDGPLTSSEIARRLGITAAAATLVVDRLIAAGHVDRVPHPSDRRAVRIVPREASVERAMGSLLPMIAEVDGVLDDFDAESRAAIQAYLEKVTAIYARHAHPAE
jgi:DNA-binding MarR family transcriptional regulator